MTGEGRRHFTPAEVERLIPRLEATMGAAMDAHAGARRIRKSLREAQRRVTLIGGARVEHEFWRSRKRELERATSTVQGGLRQVMELGGVPKDLALGLVDFPTLVQGREVNLCWRYGEKRIRFWHALDEGFAGRKPLPGGDGG